VTVADEIAQRAIEEVLHFTTNRGFVGILATGLLRSRRGLPRDEYLEHILHPNSMVRPEEAWHFDKSVDWLDFVNLSISAINTRFFRLCRAWSHNQDVWWIILAFDPVIMTHPGVHFTTTNNAYEHCQRATDLTGLRALFVQIVRRKGMWLANRGRRAPHLPTCEQAEVLYPIEVPLRFLRRIYVSQGDERDRVRGWLREFGYDDVEVALAVEKFVGVPN
jgi:ssDNA thymidine ADP-ribosyltransferase, DarT